jgi:hypothetical protein
MLRLRARLLALARTKSDDRVITALAWTALGVGAINVVVLLAQATATIHSLDLSSDYAVSLVLPTLAGHVPAGSVISLGNHAYYEAWLFERATAGLPHSRFIWEAAPFVVVGAGIALIAWCTWVAVGGLAAIIAVVALVSISDAWRVVLAMPTGRVGIAVHGGALCGVLLILAEASRTPRLSRPWLIALTVFTVLFGALAASDSLVAVTVVLPYVVAPWLWWAYERSHQALRVSVYALVTGGAALLGAALITSWMHHDHIVHSPYPVVFTTVASLVTNVQDLIGAWAGLGGGAFFGLPASGVNLLLFGAGALALAALAYVLWVLWRRSYQLLAVPSRARLTAPARVLYISFWSLVLASDLALYLLTAVSDSLGPGDHYLLSAWVAIAALLGAFARSRVGWAALLTGVTLFAILNVRTHVADGVPAFGVAPDPQLAGEIEHFARAHGARIGYSEYGDAAPITWETHFATEVYPLQPCGSASGLCAFFIGISSWYTPHPGARTFLMTDPRPGIAGGTITAAPADLGRPVAVGQFGTFTVYVYGYDIASRVGPGSIL